MNTQKILYAFAEKEGIDTHKVDVFLSGFKVETLSDLLQFPHDMQQHFSYINGVSDPLYSFIKGFDLVRYETVTLERLIDSIEDSRYYYQEKLRKGEVLIKAQIEELEKVNEVEKQLIQLKFGSIVFDW